MLLPLLKGKSIGLKTILRQLRTIIVLLMIIGSYWLVKPDCFTVYYILILLAIIALLVDHYRPKKALAERQFRPIDLVIMVVSDLFLAGIIMITGANHSPFLSAVLIPIIIFALEYETKIGFWNYLGFSIFIILNYAVNTTMLNLETLTTQIVIIAIGGTCLAIIGTLRNCQSHFERKINRILSRDELTGLYNRRFLKSSVSKEIKAKKPFGFIMIDINYFKYYNDFYGHTAGDSLLISISRILSKCVRPQDIVVRHSGDEFIIFLPDSDQTNVEKTIAKILEAIEETIFLGEECFPDQKLSISYGYTLFPGEFSNYQEIFSAADQALYRFKKSNKQ